MSKSLNRVKTALASMGLDRTLHETGEARTAQMAADQVGCQVDQIGKSILLSGTQSGKAYLFLTAGGNVVNMDHATQLAQEPLERATPAQVRAQTGFAIGGVSPIGHITQIPIFMDPRLLEFDEIWVAAGTPHHLFSVCPLKLSQEILAQVTDFIS
jgi:prolyl-tRNA editing enzyme YbaK/EbsC (Cys-tRNA(Pro) deacylase)